MTAETFFSNPFASKEITPSRLVIFGKDVLGKLNADNPNNVFKNLITRLTTDTNSVNNELGEVQSTLAVQVGKTKTVNAVIKEFKTYMSDNEGVIAKALGGKRKAAFSEFYPNGLEQYNRITKTNIEAILKQVFDAAENNKTALKTELTSELKAFTDAYINTRDAQVTQKGMVKDNRTDRTSNRTKLEVTLMLALHTVGTTFTEDTAKCCSYFNFSLLYAKGVGGKKGKGEVIEVKK